MKFASKKTEHTEAILFEGGSTKDEDTCCMCVPTKLGLQILSVLSIIGTIQVLLRAL